MSDGKSLINLKIDRDKLFERIKSDADAGFGGNDGAGAPQTTLRIEARAMEICAETKQYAPGVCKTPCAWCLNEARAECKSNPMSETTADHIQAEAYAAFDRWLAGQAKEVLALNVLEQIELYVDR